ncbi:HD domain-containing phosphohydrolase [Verrucomicrobiota bacterium]
MTDINKIIERAKHELEQMIDMNPQIMMLVDRERKILRVNRALLEFLKLDDFRELLGKKIEEIFHCDDSNFFPELFSENTGHKSREVKIELNRDSFHLLSFILIGSASEQNDTFAVIVDDITEAKEKKLHAEKQYKKEAIRAFSGAMMHNVNQPLTVIMVRAKLLDIALNKGQMDVSEFKDGLNDIITSVAEAASIVKSLEDIKDYITEPYVGNNHILDVKRSRGREPDERDGPMLMNVFMETLDAHMSDYTYHAQKTAEFALCIAKAMKLSAEEIKIIKLASLFHDIGKIGVPCEMLQKTGALSEEEMDIIRKHSKIGFDLLLCLPLPREVADVVYTHHERYDGTGYPRGLSGKDIPQASYIVAVADTFEVLRHGRNYKAGVSFEEAVKEIEACSGSQFDPGVVEVFKSCAEELNSLCSRADL